MQKMQPIFESYEAAKAAGKQVALATVVRVVGSAYRRPGAKMLVTEDGESFGSVSGGCLEKDVVLRSAEIIREGSSALLQYGMSGSDDDFIFGVGAGCNGRVDILVEPDCTFERLDPISFDRDCLRKRETGVIATVFAVDGAARSCLSERVAFRSADPSRSSFNNADLAQSVVSASLDAFSEKRSISRRFSNDEGAIEVFMEVVQPPIQLVICGNGHDVVPLVGIARELGWQVKLLDPKVEEVPVDLRFRSGSRTAVAIMTHNYWHDVKFMRQFLTSDVAYIGLLGPKYRAQKILEEILATGPLPDDSQCSKVHAPIGLDIGAEAEAEIALSIVSEIQSVLHQRFGSSLRHRDGFIHERVQRDPDELPCLP